MNFSKIRISLGAFSLIALMAIFILINSISYSVISDQNTLIRLEFLGILSNLVLIMVWIGFARPAAVFVSSVSLLYVESAFLIYNGKMEFSFLVSFIVSVIIGNRFNKIIFMENQKNTVNTERINEKRNVMENELAHNRNEVVHFENRIEMYSHLQDIAESFSSTLSEEATIKLIVENVSGMFEKLDRAVLFKVDASKQELKLVCSKKGTDSNIVRMKKGDMFDRWVFWKKQPLIVENTKKDFRFYMGEKDADKEFKSLISAPLMSGDKVLGIVRIDSKTPYCYNQEDLRLLDVVSGLASVALENATLYKRLSGLAITDGLTGLKVQKHFKQRLDEEVKRALKNKNHFALLILDIDNFKEYNDTYGHMAGDIVLKAIAKSCSNMLVAGDMAARYGGEEFAILLLGQDSENAKVSAESLRATIENNPIILRRKNTNVTVSIGVAVCPDDSGLAEDIFKAADRRLYKAKERGKNKVCVK